MNAKLIVDGKEFDIEILDPKLQELLAPKKKTGYERVGEGENYYLGLDDGTADREPDYFTSDDDEEYENANYYSDKTIAENNARADRLMRQLRRFAVEHRTEKLDWNNHEQRKYYIHFDHDDNTFDVDFLCDTHELGTLYFDSEDVALLAIDTFHDELIWYFTEYKDSL